jgi:acetyl-CoA carboxylase carboxyltransferase component
MDEETRQKTERLREIKRKAISGGGEEAVEAQRRKGKLTARERIDRLLDPDSFTEIGMLGALEEDVAKDVFGDGLVTGFGRIEGRKVCVFSQDPTVRKGTFGRVHRLKMTGILDKARKIGVPVIGLWDGAGGRLERSTSIDPSSYSTFRRFVDNSGVVPQVSAILGATAGNASYGPALTDVVFFVDGVSYAFATGPRGTKEEIGEDVSMEDLGGAVVHCRKSGLGDRRFKSEDECLSAVRKLLGFLPSNSAMQPPRASGSGRPPRINAAVAHCVPSDSRKPYDMLGLIRLVVDDGDFFEIKPEFAENIITGFGRLDGRPVGIVANQPLVMAGALTINASMKAARFIRFLDCFNVPVVFLADTTGYLPGSDQEHGGILRHGAKLPYAIAEARVAKIAVLVRKAYGGAKPAMGIDKDLGVDLVFAWPIAESAVMGARGAVKVLFGREMKEAGDPEDFLRRKVEEFRKAETAYPMAHSTFVDDIIEPEETRHVLIRSLEAILGERGRIEPATHGNIPL